MKRHASMISLILSALLALAALFGQTKVTEDQTRLKVRVVEWQRCNWTSPDGKVSCNGMELVRFLMKDGTIKGSYVLTPMGPDYKHDPSKWEVISEFK